MTRLEAIQTLPQLDAFDADAYLDGLRATLPAETTLASIEATAATLREALAVIDRFAATCMRIRLDATLAEDASVPPTFRRTLAATVLQYERDLGTLHERVEMVAARTDPVGARTTADAVAHAAAQVLAVRSTLHDGVMAFAKARAAAQLPVARKAAWDRAQDEATRAAWVAVLRSIEEFLGVPEEPEPEVVEPTRGELLEFD